ncbi:hypothetical protein [Actinokineospora cianjurensis]|uniref:Uncharacterized protein n=1 Tax=Actinokineospora cianjurensis TaxID=585224 RepID=A0A421BCD3_9PSEU|nr:hypothetical protein [Actinokineospora cianjurensis]RLK62029.1 hypothetical protein CLV68_2581 [Actinokineospora cianjurensis]
MTAPYGFHSPTLTDAENAIHRLYPSTGGQVWSSLLVKAGLTGRETDVAALSGLIDAMEKTDPVLSLCAQAFRIRSTTHTALTAAETLVRGAE